MPPKANAPPEAAWGGEVLHTVKCQGHLLSGGKGSVPREGGRQSTRHAVVHACARWAGLQHSKMTFGGHVAAGSRSEFVSGATACGFCCVRCSQDSLHKFLLGNAAQMPINSKRDVG